jgi:hypothetical protein
VKIAIDLGLPMRLCPAPGRGREREADIQPTLLAKPKAAPGVPLTESRAAVLMVCPVGSLPALHTRTLHCCDPARSRPTCFSAAGTTKHHLLKCLLLPGRGAHNLASIGRARAGLAPCCTYFVLESSLEHRPQKTRK